MFSFSRGLVLWAVTMLILTTTSAGQDSPFDDLSDLKGDYCRVRRPQTCCTNRDDQCSVPILGTLCYCDVFCNRTRSSDCCPDFWEHCMGITPPSPNIIRPQCRFGGSYYTVGQSIRLNCNKCTCRQSTHNEYEFACEERVCLIRPELMEKINRMNLDWKASNYSTFWGKTLDEGMRYRLGTYKPTRPTMDMTEIHISDRVQLPESFDSRQRWPGLIKAVSDQGDCGSSWAVSTTALASDRFAIHSNGLERSGFSAQQLLSCQNRRQRGCEGGHLDRAWWYLRKKGVATESCFPYLGRVDTCQVKKVLNGQVFCPSIGKHEKLYFSTPPYRVPPKENLIMQEIYKNGPVQATFKVHSDFFLYRYGVYRATTLPDNTHSYGESGYHSVRILGWGVDRTGGRAVNYWLCANSWGRLWGEEGLFRIVRGENECDIEMFIVGVWGKRADQRHLRHNGSHQTGNRDGNENNSIYR